MNDIAKLTEDAASGDLWIEAKVAIDSHAAFRDWLENLDQMLAGSESVGRPEGFPDIPSALQLADKFGRIATGENGLRARLTEYLDTAQQLSDLFLYSIKKFEDSDATCADYLKKHNL